MQSRRGFSPIAVPAQNSVRFRCGGKPTNRPILPYAGKDTPAKQNTYLYHIHGRAANVVAGKHLSSHVPEGWSGDAGFQDRGDCTKSVRTQR
jgi:hypothetical protein